MHAPLLESMRCRQTRCSPTKACAAEGSLKGEGDHFPGLTLSTLHILEVSLFAKKVAKLVYVGIFYKFLFQRGVKSIIILMSECALDIRTEEMLGTRMRLWHPG